MVVARSRFCSEMCQELIKAPDRLVSFANAMAKV